MCLSYSRVVIGLMMLSLKTAYIFGCSLPHFNLSTEIFTHYLKRCQTTCILWFVLNMLVPKLWLRLFLLCNYNWSYEDRRADNVHNETLQHLWHWVIPLFELEAVLKTLRVFYLVQILSNISCRDMWMIIIYLSVRGIQK